MDIGIFNNVFVPAVSTTRKSNDVDAHNALTTLFESLQIPYLNKIVYVRVIQEITIVRETKY